MSEKNNTFGKNSVIDLLNKFLDTAMRTYICLSDYK